MAKKKKNKSIQKVVKFVEASSITPAFKTVSNKSNTEYSMRNKNYINDFNLCGCNNEINTYLPKTWQSITKMYGDADTTEVWDSQGKNPKPFFKSKKRNKYKYKSKQEPELNNDFRNDKSKVKSKHQKKKKKVKKSLISLYRKRNKRNRVLNRKNLKSEKRQQVIDYNVKDNTKEEPATRFDFLYGKPINKSYHHNGTGDYSLMPNKKHRQNGAAEGRDKPNNELVVTNKKENISNGERKKRNKNTFLKDSSEKIMTIWSKCNLVKMFLNLHSSKSQNIAHNLNDEPLFEMKINSGDMRVVNSSEIKDRLKNLGKIKRKHYSKKKSLKIGENEVCTKGICENALFHNQTRFDCKCRRKKNRVVCSDTNCDLKNNQTKKKIPKSSKPKQNKPLVEVVLDRNNMNILNSNEIGDMFKKAPYYEICPTGVCEEASKDPGIELNCKCIGRKMTPMIKECSDETCVTTTKKCKLSEICSRIFCKSENRVGFERNMMRGHRRRKNVINRQYEIQKHKSGANTKEESVPVALQLTRHGGLYANACECNLKEAEVIMENIENEKRKKRKELKALRKKIRLHKIKSSAHIKPKSQNFNRNIIKCLKRKRKRCEKKIKQKEKEFKENEKKADKDNLRIEKMIEKNRNIEEPYWNFFTKFLAGILNIAIDLIVKIFSMTFSILMNPIGSFIYVRERSMDPPGTIKRVVDWFTRTWSNKKSKISETIKQSDTLNIIADQIEDSTIYDSIFASKGGTGAEKSLYERKRRLRKRRIQKRYNQAMFGCRHMLLTTMRKTPCLWFYYICPDLYPQCLSLVSFMRNFCHIIIYLLALICWTPCILFFEGCRAFLCCFFCTN